VKDKTVAEKEQFDQLKTIRQISNLSHELSLMLGTAVNKIRSVNDQTRMLSFNAQIEAGRAAQHGRGFAVVAAEMNKLSDRTSTIAGSLDSESHDLIAKLEAVSHALSIQARGQRLCDLALTNIDLIDRNLYERTCDVRWWATDPSAVDALTNRDDQNISFVSNRLGVILDAYTVYYDLVLCDLEGIVVANGRPLKYQSVGTNHRNCTWFESAIATSSSNDFGFETVHCSPLVNNQHVLVYSCTVREGGTAHGKPLGVLGVVFNWDGLAQTVVDACPLSKDEWSRSRVCIVDDNGLVLADSNKQILEEKIEFSEQKQLLSAKKDFINTKYKTKASCIAQAQSPGFETYATGWHSMIIQETDDDRQATSNTSASNEKFRSSGLAA